MLEQKQVAKGSLETPTRRASLTRPYDYHDMTLRRSQCEGLGIPYLLRTPFHCKTCKAASEQDASDSTIAMLLNRQENDLIRRLAFVGSLEAFHG